MAGENFSEAGDLRAIRGSMDALAAGAPASAGATAAKQDTIITHVDGIETSLTTLIGHIDGLEGFTDGLETVIASTNTLLTTQAGYVDELETLLISTVAGIAALGSPLTDVQLRAAPVPVSGTFWQATQPVSGPMTSAEFLADLRSPTGAHSSVASGTSSATVLAANAARKGARIRNSDANALHLDLSGGTASVDRAQVTLLQNESYAVDAGYTGAITGIWAADGAGVASVVEFS